MAMPEKPKIKATVYMLVLSIDPMPCVSSIEEIKTKKMELLISLVWQSASNSIPKNTVQEQTNNSCWALLRIFSIKDVPRETEEIFFVENFNLSGTLKKKIRTDDRICEISN